MNVYSRKHSTYFSHFTMKKIHNYFNNNRVIFIKYVKKKNNNNNIKKIIKLLGILILMLTLVEFPCIPFSDYR